MDVSAVMAEIGDQLDTIAGLRVHRFPAHNITPPAAIVSFPEDYTFDSTYGRGMDRMTLPVVLLVGKANDRAAAEQLATYIDGSGTKSVKAVVEAGTYTEFHTVRVVDVDFDIFTVGGNEYLGGTFSLDIAGSGTA